MSSDSQRDLTSGMLKVNSSALRVGGRGHQEGEIEHWKIELSLVGNKGTGKCHLPRPSPQPKSQREPVPVTELTCARQTPNAMLLWIHPFDGSASLPVLQGPSHMEPPTAKGAKPAPPTPVHLADPPGLIRQIPSKQHHKPGSVQVAQRGAPPLHSESCPWERGR